MFTSIPLHAFAWILLEVFKMKPANWSKMSKKEKRAVALKLLCSIRGEYIISQALVRAIEAMESEKYPETSNIQDMEMLLELFPIYKAIQSASKKQRLL